MCWISSLSSAAIRGSAYTTHACACADVSVMRPGQLSEITRRMMNVPGLRVGCGWNAHRGGATACTYGSLPCKPNTLYGCAGFTYTSLQSLYTPKRGKCSRTYSHTSSGAGKSSSRASSWASSSAGTSARPVSSGSSTGDTARDPLLLVPCADQNDLWGRWSWGAESIRVRPCTWVGWLSRCFVGR
jgi:hypothetical protein